MPRPLVRVLPFVLFTLLLGTGCEPPVSRCTYDSECGEDLACGPAGSCVPQCATDRDCGVSGSCTEGRCVEQPGCVYNSDCPVDQVCASHGCVPECQQDRDCSDGETCLGSACVAAVGCTHTSDCPEGQQCGPQGQCQEQCFESRDCPQGATCTEGACVTATECTYDSDCDLGRICSQDRLCIAACQESRDCASDEECTTGACTPIPSCTSEVDCTGFETCGPWNRCVEACVPESVCPTGTVCSQGACVLNDATTATISGSVSLTGLDDHSGVTVSLRGPSIVQAITGVDGTFLFRGLRPGHYVAVASAPVTVEEKLSVELLAVAGEERTVGTLSFTPAGWIRGVVHGDDGLPLPDAVITVVGTHASALSGPDGHFLVERVAAGSRALDIYANRYPSTRFGPFPVVHEQIVDTGTLTLVAASSPVRFTSTPSSTQAYLDRLYRYQALATADGEVPRYYLVKGPAGMTIDSLSGQLEWTPLATQSGASAVVIEAAIPGSAAIQAFVLDAGPAYQVLADGGFGRLAVSGEDVWAVGSGGVLRFGPNPRFFPRGLGEITGTANVQSLSTHRVSRAEFAGGDVVAMTGPFGTLAAQYAGGRASSWTPTRAAEVNSARYDGARIAAVSVKPGLLEVTAAAQLFVGTAESFAAPTHRPVSVRALDTASTTAVTLTTLTDAAANWNEDQWVDWCVFTGGGLGSNLKVTANTATTLTLSGSNLSQYFSVGTPILFAPNCHAGTIRLRLEDPEAALGTLPSGTRLGVVSGGTKLQDGPILGNTATSIDFLGGISSYGQLVDSAELGTARYLLGNANGYEAILVDPAAAFPLDTASTYRIVLEAGWWWTPREIVRSTNTSLTVRVELSDILGLVAPGVRYHLKTLSDRVPSRVWTRQALIPGAHAGKALYVDQLGYALDVISNDGQSMQVSSSYAPTPEWIGPDAVPIASRASKFPVVLTHAPGEPTPGDWAGRLLYVEIDGALRWFGSELASVGPNSVEIAFEPTGAGRPLRTLLDSVGRRYATNSDRLRSEQIPVTLQLTPSANLTPAALVGARIAIDGDGTRQGEITDNGVDWISITLPTDRAVLFAALAGGTRVFWTRPNWDQSFELRVIDLGAAHTAGRWAGATYVASNGSPATITTHSESSFDLLVPPNSLAGVTAGGLFAIATTSSSGNCAAAVHFNGNLGQPVDQSPYDALSWISPYGPSRLGLVVSRSGLDFQGEICPQSFPDFLAATGRQVMLSAAGKIDLHFQLAGASWEPNAHQGKVASWFTPPFSAPLAANVVSNDATAFSILTEVDQFDEVLAAGSPGSRVYLLNPDWTIDATLRVPSLSLAEGLLSGGAVSLFRQSVPTGQTAWPASNSGDGFTFRFSRNELKSVDDALRVNDSWMALTLGTHLRLTGLDPLLPPGLVGRTVRGEGWQGTIIRADADTLDAVISYPVAVATQSSAAFTIAGLEPSGPVDATAQGAWVSSAFDGAFLLGDDGIDAFLGPVGPAALWVIPRPPAATGQGTVRKVNAPYARGQFWELEDPAQTWGINALAGRSVRLRANSSIWTGRVLANSATVLRIAPAPDSVSLNGTVGYALDVYGLNVISGDPGDGQLVGRTVSVGGSTFGVLEHAAGVLRLSGSPDLGNPRITPMVAAPTGSWLVTGHTEGRDMSDLAAVEAGPLHRLARGVLHRLESGAWLEAGDDGSGPAVASGTLTDSWWGVIRDDSAAFDSTMATCLMVTPSGFSEITNVVDGQRLQLSVDAWHHPVVGEAYSIHCGRRLKQLVDLEGTEGSLFAAGWTSLYRWDASAGWSRETAASTESAPGAGDGLPEYVRRVAARDPAHVWALSNSGASRWDGIRWIRYTAAATETSPGASDGLGSDTVLEMGFTSDATLFVGPNVVSRWDSDGGWHHYGGAQGFPSTVDVKGTPSGRVLMVTAQGEVIEVIPEP